MKTFLVRHPAGASRVPAKRAMSECRDYESSAESGARPRRDVICPRHSLAGARSCGVTR